MAFWMAFFVALAFTVAGELLRPKPKPQDVQAASIDDFDIPTVSETRNWPWIVGTCLIEGGNVTSYGGLRTEKIQKKVKTGLWSSTRVTVNVKYFMSLEVFLGVGPIDDVLEVRFGKEAPKRVTKSVTPDEIVFNFNDPDFFGGNEKDGGVVGTLRIAKGTRTQNSNSVMQVLLGRARSAYRGLCFGVFENFYFGTRETIKPISFIVKRCPNSLGVTGGKHEINGDANAACAIYELLENTSWAAAVNSGAVDINSFIAVADTTHGEGLGVSMIVNNARSATDIIADILRHIDGVLYSDVETGLLTLALARGGYNIEELPKFTEDDDVSSFSYSRGSWSETKNVVFITYTDRSEDFTQRSIPYRDTANIQGRGGIVDADEVPFLGFSNANAALKRGAVAAKVLGYPLLTGKLALNGRARKLRPGSVFRLDFPSEGISDIVLRVTRINYGDIRGNRIELDCIEDIFAVSAIAFTPPPPSNWQNPVGPVQAVAAQYAFEAPYHLVRQDSRFVAVVASRFGGIDEGYEAWFDAAGGTNYIQGETNTEWTPTGVLSAAYPANGPLVDAVGFTVGAARDMEGVVAATADEQRNGDALAIIRSTAGEEWIAYKGLVNNGNGTYTVKDVWRAVLDSVPLSHPAGARIWFVSYGIGLLSATPHGANGTVTSKLLPFNVISKLPIADATQLAASVSQRASKPYPPANLLVDGSANDDTITGNATITWAIRHRTLQAQNEVILPQTEGSYGSAPEGGYELRFYIDGAVRRTVQVTAAPFSSFDYTPAMRLADYADVTKMVRVGIRAVNGALASVERLSHDFFMLDALNPLVITTTSLPQPAIGTPYSVQLLATGGATPYTWSIAAGAPLPDGFSLSPSGLLTGTATVAFSHAFTVQVEGPAGITDTHSMTLSVTTGCDDYVIPLSEGAIFDLSGSEENLAPAANELHICGVIRDQQFANVTSLLHFDGVDAATSIVDVTSATWTPAGSAQLDTAQRRFGQSSLLLNGTTDYIRSSSASSVLAGFQADTDFTFELMVRPAELSGIRYLATKRDTGEGREWTLYLNEGAASLAVFDNAGTQAVALSAPSSIALNTWSAIAFTRAGNVWRLFVNGSLVASQSVSFTYGTNSDPLTIGSDPSTPLRFLSGHIDEVRTTKGVARYAAEYQLAARAFPDK